MCPLIPNKIECINKQLMLNIDWPDETIWKSVLNIAATDDLLFGKLF